MHKAIFWDYQVDSRGAWLKCHIPNELIDERFVASVMRGEIRVDDGRRISSEQRKKIYALCRDISDYTGHDVEDLKENILKVGFMIKEDRDYFSLSDVDQRKKIYALCRDISDYTGHDVEDLKENILKVGFMIKEDRDYFSLSDVDMTTARYFIEYILEFCFEWDVPTMLRI